MPAIYRELECRIDSANSDEFTVIFNGNIVNQHDKTIAKNSYGKKTWSVLFVFVAQERNIFINSVSRCAAII